MYLSRCFSVHHPQRRFILKNLRDFGFGKKSMEGLVHEEIQELIEGFKKDVGKPITTQNRFNAGTAFKI